MKALIRYFVIILLIIIAFALVLCSVTPFAKVYQNDTSVHFRTV